MNKKHVYHKPQPHTLRVHFDNAYMDTAEYPSKAAATRDIPALRALYPYKRITVEKVNG